MGSSLPHITTFGYDTRRSTFGYDTRRSTTYSADTTGPRHDGEMEPLRHPVGFVRDFARDITRDYAPRTARRSKDSMKRRLLRLRSRIFFIVQCSVSAGLAWWFTTDVLKHPSPYLAPVAAIVCLGMTFGQRYRRVIEVTVGVALGVLIGTAFAHFFGAGPWQIIVVAAISMCLAALLGAGVLISTQAAIQGLIVVTLVVDPEIGGFDRWLDALVGAVIALLAATVAPASPIGKPRVLATKIVTNLGGIIADAAKAYRNSDGKLAATTLRRARASESDFDQFDAATKEGLAVVRLSPFHRRNAPGVQEIAQLAGPLDRAMRNTRVLVRRIGTALWRQEAIDPRVIELLSDLSILTGQLAEPIKSGEGSESMRGRLVTIANTSNDLPIESSLSSAVVVAQMRSIVVDLLELTGLSYDEARKRLTGYVADNPLLPDPGDPDED